MFCTNCGSKLLEQVNFCGDCGTKVLTRTELTAPPTRPAPPAPPVPPLVPRSEPPPPPPATVRMPPPPITKPRFPDPDPVVINPYVPPKSNLAGTTTAPVPAHLPGALKWALALYSILSCLGLLGFILAFTERTFDAGVVVFALSIIALTILPLMIFVVRTYQGRSQHVQYVGWIAIGFGGLSLMNLTLKGNFAFNFGQVIAPLILLLAGTLNVAGSWKYRPRIEG